MSRRTTLLLAWVFAATIVLQPGAVGAAPKAGSSPTSTTRKLDDERSRVNGIARRIEDLTDQLTSLIAQLRSLDTRVEEASRGVASATVGLQKAEQRTAVAKQILSARAREAYKRGTGWQEAAMFLDVRSVGELLSASRLMSGSIAADRIAYDQAIASVQALTKKKEDLTNRREDLFAASDRLQKVREQTVAALKSEQQILANAQADLAALEEQRRREEEAAARLGTDARRAARQIELDRKLDSLLGWIVPPSGPAGFMPEGLRSSEVVTTGMASWYGPGFHGRRASSGSTYRQEQLTAASLVLPFGTFLKVTRGSRAVIVVITDRGPYVPGRVLDLSLAAAQVIGLSGVAPVEMEILVPASASPPFP